MNELDRLLELRHRFGLPRFIAVLAVHAIARYRADARRRKEWLDRLEQWRDRAFGNFPARHPVKAREDGE